ncbi:MAG: SUMF1/EgtB/PvdO family nonheme iron enzyme [Muribaculaceae bacterium]|nr:SUMF1/EgtB/PvdO family nonheme iron enzyme [Muribaculaceae bacterium]
MQLYYFISADGRRLGPVPGEELVNCGITPDTLVWGQNMSGWAPANTVPEIVALFTSQPQPTQPQSLENATEMPEPSSTVGNTPIQTENDIDSPSTSDPQTPESTASELPNPGLESDNKNRDTMWGAIVIIVAMLIILCWVLFVKNSNSNPSAETAADSVAVVEGIKAVEGVEVNGVEFNMIYVEGSLFDMGATLEQGDDYFADERPTHQVTLSDYYIGETEVTQELWVAVMGNNPSRFTGNSRNPVEEVSWYDCIEFIQELNRLTGKHFRLPTEAEWEFAARGGSNSKGYKYSGSNRIDEVAWYNGNSVSMTHEVATCAPNELGIYDMSGNVYEWCSDWYGEYPVSSQTDPSGSTNGSYCVNRGGSWGSSARYCRVSCRYYSTPDFRYDYLGFRLVCSSL